MLWLPGKHKQQYLSAAPFVSHVLNNGRENVEEIKKSRAIFFLQFHFLLSTWSLLFLVFRFIYIWSFGNTVASWAFRFLYPNILYLTLFFHVVVRIWVTSSGLFIHSFIHNFSQPALSSSRRSWSLSKLSVWQEVRGLLSVRGPANRAATHSHTGPIKTLWHMSLGCGRKLDRTLRTFTADIWTGQGNCPFDLILFFLDVFNT